MGDLKDSRYSGKLFDIIILWHVFEHMSEPEALLREISRHLNPGGLVVLRAAVEGGEGGREPRR